MSDPIIPHDLPARGPADPRRGRSVARVAEADGGRSNLGGLLLVAILGSAGLAVTLVATGTGLVAAFLAYVAAGVGITLASLAALLASAALRRLGFPPTRRGRSSGTRVA